MIFLRAFGTGELTHAHRYFEHVSVQVILRLLWSWNTMSIARFAMKSSSMIVSARKKTWRRGFCHLHGSHAFVQRHHGKAFTLPLPLRDARRRRRQSRFMDRAYEIDVADVKEVSDHEFSPACPLAMKIALIAQAGVLERTTDKVYFMDCRNIFGRDDSTDGAFISYKTCAKSKATGDSLNKNFRGPV